ncbi:hypothetical protein Avbf_16490, partial [Armadillidium vulgare]
HTTNQIVKIQEKKTNTFLYIYCFTFPSNLRIQQDRVICTLDSIDSIKSLKRSPQHIFVEVLGPGSGFRVSKFRIPISVFPISEFRVENPIPRLRTFIHICSETLISA